MNTVVQNQKRSMVVLPSGFITPINPNFKNTSEAKKPNPLYKAPANIAGYDYLDESKTVYHREMISTIYALASNSGKPDAEKVLKFLFTIMETIGMTNVTAWFSLQANSVHISPSAKVYILETLAFVLNNTPRLHAPNIYRSLAKALDNNGVSGFDKSFKADVGKYSPTSVEKFLSLWLSRDNGVTDLIDFAYIVFVNKKEFDSFKGG